MPPQRLQNVAAVSSVWRNWSVDTDPCPFSAVRVVSILRELLKIFIGKSAQILFICEIDCRSLVGCGSAELSKMSYHHGFLIRVQTNWFVRLITAEINGHMFDLALFCQLITAIVSPCPHSNNKEFCLCHITEILWHWHMSTSCSLATLPARSLLTHLWLWFRKWLGLCLSQKLN